MLLQNMTHTMHHCNLRISNTATLEAEFQNSVGSIPFEGIVL